MRTRTIWPVLRTTLGIFFVLIWTTAKGEIIAGPLGVEELTDNVYIYTTFNEFDGIKFPANGMYVVTDAGVVLIDTPWDTTQFQPLLDHIEKVHDLPVVLCIATHFHDDRTAGLEYYAAKGIPTWTSHFTYDLCRQHNEKTAQNRFDNDTVFTVGQFTFETFYPGPGHTADNIVIWIPALKILYGGCFLKSTAHDNLGNLEDASPRDWQQSLMNVQAKKWDYNYAVPGHFDWQDKGSVEHTLKLTRKYLRKNK
jgi:metallo-beta-lactamase class B